MIPTRRDERDAWRRLTVGFRRTGTRAVIDYCPLHGIVVLTRVTAYNLIYPLTCCPLSCITSERRANQQQRPSQHIGIALSLPHSLHDSHARPPLRLVARFLIEFSFVHLRYLQSPLCALHLSLPFRAPLHAHKVAAEPHVHKTAVSRRARCPCVAPTGDAALMPRAITLRKSQMQLRGALHRPRPARLSPLSGIAYDVRGQFGHAGTV